MIRLLLLTGAFVFFLSAVRSSAALAHAIIVRTSPEQGKAAPKTIGKVEVWYDAGMAKSFGVPRPSTSRADLLLIYNARKNFAPPVIPGDV